MCGEQTRFNHFHDGTPPVILSTLFNIKLRPLSMLLGDPEYAANMSTGVRGISSEDGSTGNWKVVPPASRTVCNFLQIILTCVC